MRFLHRLKSVSALDLKEAPWTLPTIGWSWKPRSFGQISPSWERHLQMDHLETTAERDLSVCGGWDRTQPRLCVRVCVSMHVLSLQAFPWRPAHCWERHVADCQPPLSSLSLHHVSAGGPETLPIQADYSEIKTRRQELSEGHSLLHLQLYYSKSWWHLRDSSRDAFPTRRFPLAQIDEQISVS